MSEVSGDRAVNMLYITSPQDQPVPQSAAPNWLRLLLSNPSIALIECPDVYRGLARLGRDDDGTIRAVIVCVDTLTPVELEFFDLTSRLHRDVPVYVYGRDRSRSRIDEALAHGARAEISDDKAHDLLARLVDLDAASAVGHHDANETTHASVQANQHTESNVPPPIVLTHDDDEADDEPSNDGRNYDDEAPTSPARVPWLKYDGAPERSAPEHTPPVSPKPSDRPGASPPRRNQTDYEPLLTDEELRALIGDDLTSLGPERAHERSHDDPNRAGGQG
jgi:hypothetical protein